MALLPSPAALDVGLDRVEHVQIALRIIRTQHDLRAHVRLRLFARTSTRHK